MRCVNKKTAVITGIIFLLAVNTLELSARRRHIHRKRKAHRLKRHVIMDSPLQRLFGSDISDTGIGPLNGTVAGAAIQGSYLYLLVKNFNIIADVIIKIERTSGKIRFIWGIRKHRAAAIATDGKYLWVLSNSKRYFIRKLDTSGRGLSASAITSLPPGRLCGLVPYKGGFIFGATEKGKASLYHFRPRQGIKALFSYKGDLQALGAQGTHLRVLIKHGADLHRQELLFIDPATGTQKRLNFIHRRVIDIAYYNDKPYLLETGKKCAHLSRAVFLPEQDIIAADPVRRSVKIVLPPRGAQAAGVWFPLPATRKFQTIRSLIIKPDHPEIKTDRFGNRWLHLSRTGGARIEFEFTSCDRAVTLNNEYYFKKADLPAVLITNNLKKTAVYDTASYIIKSHSTRISLSGSYRSRLLSICTYIRRAIQPSTVSLSLTRGSEFLYRGRGGALGRSLAFITLTRWLGIPARSALMIDCSEKRKAGSPQIFSCSQVPVPGKGWVDITFGGTRPVSANTSFGYHPGSRLIVFTGSFDTPDFKTVFTRGQPLPRLKVAVKRLH